MKLYVLNATPNRSRIEQFNGGVALNMTQEQMDGINRIEIEAYPKTVARVLMNFGLDGFTIYKVDGYWKGTPEVSFKIEVALDDGSNDGGADARSTIEMVAEELRALYNQDSVMLTHPDGTVEFIEEK